MGKMFKCEDGAMFLIDEIVSIEEAARYCDKKGNKINPVRIFSSEKELQDAIPSVVRQPEKHFFIISLLCFVAKAIDISIELLMALIIVPVWFLCHAILKYVFKVKLGSFITPRAERLRLKREEEIRKRAWEKQDEINARECYLDYGYFCDKNYKSYTVKQWEVKVKNQKEKIHIFNSDYERLCAEMGN